ncbi:hypothetical protein D3C87_1894790 [compost metagenome]
MRSRICGETATTPRPDAEMRRYASRKAGQYSLRPGELSQSSRAKNVVCRAQPRGENPATSGLQVTVTGSLSPRRCTSRHSDAS